MQISVQTPTGWQAPATPLATLNYQPLTPATSSAGATLQGVQAGEAIGAPIAATASALTDAVINGPLAAVQRKVALKEANLQSTMLDRQQAIRNAQAQYYGMPGASTQDAPATAPGRMPSEALMGTKTNAAGPVNAGDTVSASQAEVNASMPPLPLADPNAGKPLPASAPPSVTASPAAQPAPVSAPTGIPAPAQAPASQPQPGAPAVEMRGGAPWYGDATWEGAPFSPGSIMRGGRFRPGTYGEVQPDLTIKPVQEKMDQHVVTDGASGKSTIVTTDPRGNIVTEAQLPQTTSKANEDALADFNKGSSTSIASSTEGLEKLNQLEDALDSQHGWGTGAISGKILPPVLNQNASNINGMTDALVGLAKTIPGSKFTNMDFNALRGQVPSITDYQTSYKAKANELRDAFISNIERQNYVQSRISQGAPISQAQQEYTSFLGTHPILAPGAASVTRSTPLAPSAIQGAMNAPTVSTQAQYDNVPSGSHYYDYAGALRTKP